MGSDTSGVAAVYILWHVHPIGEHDDEKVIGVYANEEDAEAAISRLRDRAGFKECPAGFIFERYEIGKDHWTEGYVTVP